MSTESARKLLRHSLKTLLSYKNIDYIDVIDICAESSISRSTFYRLYKDKYDLMNECYRVDMDQIIWSADFNDWSGKQQKIVDYLIKNRNYLYHAIQSKGQNNFLSFLYDYLEKQYTNLAIEQTNQKELNETQSTFIAYHTAGAIQLIKLFLIHNKASTLSKSQTIFTKMMPYVLQEVEKLV